MQASNINLAFIGWAQWMQAHVWFSAENVMLPEVVIRTCCRPLPQ